MMAWAKIWENVCVADTSTADRSSGRSPMLQRGFIVELVDTALECLTGRDPSRVTNTKPNRSAGRGS